MAAAEGILTARGGMTSHAAVVARGMGKCCVSGAGGIVVDYKARTLTVDGQTLKEGDFLSLNGTTGCVYAGEIPTEAAELSGDFSELMDLCAKYARLQVRTNADTPKTLSSLPSSAQWVSVFAARSTCSSKPKRLSPCAK